MLVACAAFLMTVSIVVIASALEPVFSSPGSTSTPKAVPFLDLVHLNASMASQYGIPGLLTVTSPYSGSTLAGEPGQVVQFPVVLRLTSFDSKLDSVVVSLKTVPGEVSVGSSDISGLESYSVSSVQVHAGKATTIMMSFRIPGGVASLTGGSISLIPAGIDVTPSNVAVVINTNVLVATSSAMGR